MKLAKKADLVKKSPNDPSEVFSDHEKLISQARLQLIFSLFRLTEEKSH